MTVVGPGLAPPVELQRWLHDSRSRPYEFRPRAAGLHALASKRHKVPIELPLVLYREGAVGGLLASIHALEERLAPRETLFPGRGDRQFVEALCGSLFSPAVQTFYFHMLPVRRVLTPAATAGSPMLDMLAVRAAYPLWRRAMAKGLSLGTFDAARAETQISNSFAAVEKALGTSRFLGGDLPDIRDIVFAVLASPVILPKGHPAAVPPLDQLPEPFRTQVQRWRASAAGQLAQRVYEHRSPPVIWGRTPPDKLTLSQRLLTPKLVRGLARGAARFAPRVLKLGKQVLVSRWSDVGEVLSRDSDLLIGPINAERISGVMGPFILGMDASPELHAQRRAAYGALHGVDHAGAARLVAQEAARIASECEQRFGRIDVVSTFARPVAARAAVLLFGVAGPSEADLMRAVRAVFQETFLNLSGDAEVTKAGREAGAEIAAWIKSEIAMRRARKLRRPDLLGRLLNQVDAGALPAEQVPWITAGMLVGAIDTTATVVANIVTEIVTDDALRAAMQQDRNDSRRLLGWCWEALRRRPHNPLVMREAAGDVELAGSQIRKGTRVWALTLAAMQDARVFSRPSVLEPTRPLDHYLHFGGGLHRCSGREFNAKHIPILVGTLLNHGVARPHQLSFRGPFPDRLVVSLKGSG